MRSPRAWLLFAGSILLLLRATPAPAQSIAAPRPSPLWAAAAHRAQAPDAARAGAAISRTNGLAVGFTIGGVVAGVFGYRMCQAYSALGDCLGTAFWWAAIGGMLGGLIGASAGEDGASSKEPA